MSVPLACHSRKQLFIRACTEKVQSKKTHSLKNSIVFQERTHNDRTTKICVLYINKLAYVFSHFVWILSQ